MSRIIEIDNFDAEELEPYRCRSEVQLLRRYEPAPGIFIAESPKIIRRALDAGYAPISFLMDRKVAAEQAADILERCGDIPVYVSDGEVLGQLVGYKMTSGALCAMRRRALCTAEEICAGASRMAVLEDIVNPINVGAIFRSAAALGFDAVLLTPACCDPLYRRALRVSMGTVFQVPWTFLDDPGEAYGRKEKPWREGPKDRKRLGYKNYVERLKAMGFATAAMALAEDSVGIDHPKLVAEERLAVILGTEGDGLKPSTIESCDYTVKIPMSHGVDSLNVAAASAVAFWQLGKR